MRSTDESTSTSTVGTDRSQQEDQSVIHRIRAYAEMLLGGAKEVVTDFGGGVRVDVPVFLSKCHLWAAVCLVAHSFALWIGMNEFYIFQAIEYGGWIYQSTISDLICPCLLIWCCMEHFATAFGDSERMVLVASVFLGILHGRVMRNVRLAMFAPMAPIIPLCMASYARILGSSAFIRNDRRIFILTTLSTAACICSTGGLAQSDPSYFLYLILLVLAAFIDLQLKIGKSNKGSLGPMPLEQWKTVVILATVDCFAYWMLSEDAEFF